MNTLFEPMLAAELGGLEIVMIVLVVMFCVFVVPVTGTVAIVYFIARRVKTKPQPTPVAPIAPASPKAPASPLAPMAAASRPAQASPAISETIVMKPHACPECGTALPPNAPEGLCPGCLLKRGFATETGAPASQSVFVPPSVLELAQLFPQLEIQECLGRGGMGAVYKARQPRLDRFVALKILAPEKQNDPQFAERFEREARVLARLNHPNIVSVFDFGEVQGRFYLIMEYVDGLTLRQVMQRGKISPAEALQLVPKICEALQFAHEHGIVHRDIKPENILLNKEGRVKIADFGIAKIAGVEAKGLSLTGARDVMGTPNYMAPEQIEKPQTVDHRADIYSLGVVFYEMLTGELPLGKFAPPSKKVQMDVRLDEVVLHALEKEPERRYQHASQVKTAVETISGTPPPFAPAPMAAAATPLASAGIITVPAVALMIIGAWKMFSGFLGLLAVSGVNVWLGSFLGLGNLLGIPLSIAIFSTLLFKIVPGAVILFGGYQMVERRSYGWAVAAAIIAIIACSLMSLLSLPIGIWALVVLSRDDVKSAFGAATPAVAQPGHFWRYFTLIAGGLVLFVLAMMVTATLVFVSTAKSKATGWDWSKFFAGTAPATPGPVGAYQFENGEYRTNFSQTLPLAADGRLSIDNVNGRTDIHGWNSNIVVITTAIHGRSAESVAATQVHIDSDPNHVSVHTDLPSDRDNFSSFWDWLKSRGQNNATVDYTVQVPEHARLEEVTTVNGHIVIAGVAGNIGASTVNGEAEIKGAAGNLKLHTVNGTITAEMDSLDSGQSVSLNAVNGELKLSVPEDADATFSINTLNGGISSEFPSLQAKKEWPVGNHLKGSLGHGSATVKADTINGTVEILKSPAAKPGPAIAPQKEMPATNGSAPAKPQPGAQAAIAAAQKWLALIDAGNYSKSWNDAAAIFQGGVTEPAWENSMNTFRKPLGGMVSRQLKSSQSLTQMPGAPDGQYVVMQFDTSFANKSAAVETVTFDLEKDGQWKSSGYFIK